MKALREMYAFITGGSIVSVIGLALAIGVTIADGGFPPGLRAGLFIGCIAASFVAATFERIP